MDRPRETRPPGIDRREARSAGLFLASRARDAEELAEWLHAFGLLRNPGDYRAAAGPMGEHKSYA